MNRFRKTRLDGVVLAVLVCLLPGAAHAQSLPSILYHDVKAGFSDLIAVWIAPVRGDLGDYRTAGIVIGTAGALTLVDDDIGRWIYQHPKHGVLEVLQPFREKSDSRLMDLGGAKNLGGLIGATYLTGLVFQSADLRAAALGCFSAVGSGVVTRHLLYDAVARERPLYIEITADGDTTVRRGDPFAFRIPGKESWYENSFFGGHGANILGCASFLNHRFDMGLAEPLIWIVAAGVNVGRMADQRHWASDVLLGAVVGYATGKYVAERSLARARKRESESNDKPAERQGNRLLKGLYLTPGSQAWTVGWKTRF